MATNYNPEELKRTLEKRAGPAIEMLTNYQNLKKANDKKLEETGEDKEAGQVEVEELAREDSRLEDEEKRVNKMREKVGSEIEELEERLEMKKNESENLKEARNRISSQRKENADHRELMEVIIGTLEEQEEKLSTAGDKINAEIKKVGDHLKGAAGVLRPYSPSKGKLDSISGKTLVDFASRTLRQTQADGTTLVKQLKLELWLPITTRRS